MRGYVSCMCDMMCVCVLCMFACVCVCVCMRGVFVYEVSNVYDGYDAGAMSVMSVHDM